MSKYPLTLQQLTKGKYRLFLIVEKDVVLRFRFGKKGGFSWRDQAEMLQGALTELKYTNQEKVLLDASTNQEILFFRNKKQFHQENAKKLQEINLEPRTPLAEEFWTFLHTVKFSDFDEKTYAEFVQTKATIKERGQVMTRNKFVREQFNASRQTKESKEEHGYLYDFLEKSQDIFQVAKVSTQGKYTLNFYWGKKTLYSQEYLQTNLTKPVLWNKKEFTKLFSMVYQPWVRIVLIMTYIYGFSLREMKDLTLEKFKQLLETSDRVRFGDLFQNPELNYRATLEREIEKHYTFLKNTYLFSLKRDKRVKKENFSLIASQLKEAIGMPIRPARFHAIFHYLYHTRDVKSTTKLYKVSKSTLYTAVEDLLFELDTESFPQLIVEKD